MKLLLVCRIYSGLDLDRWSVSSTPAILKFIERLEQRSIDTTVLFLAKRANELPGTRPRPLRFDGFDRVTFEAVWKRSADYPDHIRALHAYLKAAIPCLAEALVQSPLDIPNSPGYRPA